MKTIPLLMAALALTCCKDKDVAGDWAKEGKAPRAEKSGSRRPDRAQLPAGYEEGMKSLTELKATHAKLKREEMAASSGRNFTNMALLRELEGSIAILEADLAKMKARPAGKP